MSTFCRGFNGSWWTDEELQWRDTAGNLVTWDFTNNQTTGKKQHKMTTMLMIMIMMKVVTLVSKFNHFPLWWVFSARLV